jgi:small subunit ribosomal protein S2
MSALPKFSMKDLMEAGVHFGHKTMRWNAKMAPFIHGESNNIHIVDLNKTVPMLHRALEVARQTAAKNGRILFVATKRQASSIIAEAAERSGQYFVNFRWMGGTLTNWNTVSKSIKTLNTLESNLADESLKFNKKERLTMQREVGKLNNALGGIRKMGGQPDLLIIIDTIRERIAVKEANKLGIPVVAIADTNSDPDGIDYVIPGNDDSIKAIKLYCDLFADAILAGMSESLSSKGKDKPEAETEGKKAAKAEPKKAETVVKKAKVAKAANKVTADAEEAPKAEKAPAKKAEPKAKAEKAEAKPVAKKAAAKK